MPNGVPEAIRTYRLKKAHGQGQAMSRMETWLLEQFHANKDGIDKPYRPEEIPIVAINMGTHVVSLVSDPAAIEDLFVKKEACFEKHPLAGSIYSDLIGESFSFAEGDQRWQDRHGACYHAFAHFYIIEKQQAIRPSLSASFMRFDQPAEEVKRADTTGTADSEMDDGQGAQNDDGAGVAEGQTVTPATVTIDMAEELERITCDYYARIAFGAELSEAQLEIQWLDRETE
mgnify:CR=1 FL=1